MRAKLAKPVAQAKSMAKSLRSALAVKQVALSHAECLEIVARQLGFPDWNTLCAKLSLEASAASHPKRPGGAGEATRPAAQEAGALLRDVPVVPLRDVVVYPGTVIPLYAGRARTVRAMQAALRGDRQAMLLTQRRVSEEDPKAEDLYGIGTLADVVEVVQLPNGNWRILVGGRARARVEGLEVEPDLKARITVIGEPASIELKLQALRSAVSARFEQYARDTGWPHLPGRVDSEPSLRAQTLATFALLADGRFADTIAAHVRLPLPQKQQVLETLDVRERLTLLESALSGLEQAAAHAVDRAPPST